MIERLIEIEKKLTFQEHTIEELNQVIIGQEKTIKDLALQVQLLQKQLSDEPFVKDQADEEPPPHY